MLKDLDRGMKERGLESVIICGGPSVSWETAYLVGPVKITWAHVLKRVDEEPILIVNAMERAEAAKGRVRTVSYNDVGVTPLLFQDLPRAEREAAMIERILDHHGCTGKVAIYGAGPISTFSECLRILRERCPDTFVPYHGRRSLFEEATITKEAEEIERIVNVGLRVEDVYRNIINYLTTLRSDGKRVFDIEGEPITVGDIKDMIVREAGRWRLDVPVDVIFAQGPLSAIPHNRGESDENLRAGVPVVFDLVGRERRGLYFEVTRTFCIGQSTARFDEVFELVKQAREVAFENLKPGRTAREVNDKVSEFFEGHGFPTLRQGPGERGFIHILGHGIGYELYEHPRIGPVEEGLELTPGMVLTIEPGLYLPEEGFGVRVGDVAVIEKDGPPRRLTTIRTKAVLTVSR